MDAKGRAEPFTVEAPADTLRRRLLLDQALPRAGPASLGSADLPRAAHWPEAAFPAARGPQSAPEPGAKGPPVLTLVDALEVAAANNREFLAKKEDIFRAALNLDLERDAFRSTFAGALDGVISRQAGVSGAQSSASAGWSRTLKAGASLAASIVIDLVKLLTLDRSSSFGILADASITVPLMLGSGRHIVTEPLTQAEREALYAIYAFERFKRTLAVQVATEHLGVLQQLDQVRNAEDNYRRLVLAARRARRLADAGRLPEIQVDQARQDELRARDRWIAAQQGYAGLRDAFKLRLGLPADARMELDPEELERLADAAREALSRLSATASAGAARYPEAALAADAPVELLPPGREGAGPLEMDPGAAIELALRHRLDLREQLGRVEDAQRGVVVAADALRAGLTLVAGAQVGERRSLAGAGLKDAALRLDEGGYEVGLLLDLPWERTAEGIAYRDSYIGLERAVRDLQALEDDIKLQVRNALRALQQARESFRIQSAAMELARRRVKSSELFLQAGRAQIRDLLEAQEALVSAQNAYTSAMVDYRIAELELQRDMGLLQVDHRGLWSEFRPQNPS